VTGVQTCALPISSASMQAKDMMMLCDEPQHQSPTVNETA
jgi:hypothetical protein